VDGDGPLGVVLSGGGARGAYEAGVLAELLPLLAADTPVIVVGTSAGAINAALLGAAIARRGDPMADPAGLWSSVGWRDVVGPLWRALASADLGLHTAALGRRPLPQALLDNDPLRQTLEARIDWLGLHRAVRDGALGALAVVATSAGNRRPVVFVEAGTTLAAAARLRAAATADPLADYRAVRLGPQHLMASAAIPALFPAVALPGAGAGTTEWFVDGGIERNAPVEAALALGARRLLVISPSPVPAARTPDAGAPTGPPGLLGGGLQLLETILGGQLSRELAAATVADGRRVPTLLVTPSSQGGDPLAEASAAVLSRRSGRRLTAPWDDGAILRRMAGDGPGADALVSYLHFDTAFLAAAVAQGREDGRRAVTAAALARIPTSTVRERPAATAPHGDDRSLHVRAVPATVGPLLHPERQS
jgi:NTE family protein